jgi:arylsulfatase
MLRLALLLGFATPILAGEGKPNVVIVMTDDNGLGDFSFTGNPVLKTPNFDAFAKESVRFTDFHVTPMCSPTRGQLMTGIAALRNGATSVTAGRTFLRPGLPTMPELFAKAGYRTGLFGKWHLGDLYPHRPMDKGFQESVYHLGWGMLNASPEYDNPLFDGRYFHNGEAKTFKGHCTDHWFDSATTWMKQCQERNEPFLCYIPTNAPHAPYIEKDEYIQPYKGKGPAGFFGMIAHLDARFGELDRFLAERKLKDNTIVVFMTDNGGTAGVATFNAGLRAGKTTYYDGGHRVPCWIRWPNGKLGQPRDIDTPASNLDILPTLQEFCGVKGPERPALTREEQRFYAGTSLAPLLKDTPTAIGDRMIVVQYGQTPAKFECCIAWKQWRLVKGAELYDVVADRAQAKNVFDQHPVVVKAMKDYYEGWWKGVEPLLKDFVPNHIGAKQQPRVELTSADWQDIYADNAGFVRQAVGGPTGGVWHIQVEEAGEYEFVLHRWPEQTKKALGDKYDNPEDKRGESKGFPEIAKAKVEIAGVKGEAPADAKALGAAVKVTLPAGKTTLKAWFQDANGKDVVGAFYVYVTKK